MGLPLRLLENLQNLRGSFAVEMECNTLPSLHHALVIFRDDLKTEDVTNCGGLMRQQPDGSMYLSLPRLSEMHIASFSSLSEWEPPEWTEAGKQAFLPMAWNILPEARKVLIARPGWVADSCLLAQEFTREVQFRRSRLDVLAIDACMILGRLWSLTQLPILSSYAIYHDGNFVNRRLHFVHRLACLEGRDPDSLLQVERDTWIQSDKGVFGFLPYDEGQLRAMSNVPFFMGKKITIPPDRYVSVLSHDVFTSSAHAIDDLFAMVSGAGSTFGQHSSLNREQMNEFQPPPLSKDLVFISYCHKDEAWRCEIETMLAPAARYRSMAIWHDKKLKPGEVWQAEIGQALRRARIGVLLVTKDFLASEFINDVEMKFLAAAAKANAVKLLWIAVGHCLWEHSPIREFQCVNSPDSPLAEIPSGAGRDRAIKDACKKIVIAYEGPPPSRTQ